MAGCRGSCTARMLLSFAVSAAVNRIARGAARTWGADVSSLELAPPADAQGDALAWSVPPSYTSDKSVPPPGGARADALANTLACCWTDRALLPGATGARQASKAEGATAAAEWHMCSSVLMPCTETCSRHAVLEQGMTRHALLPPCLARLAHTPCTPESNLPPSSAEFDLQSD